MCGIWCSLGLPATKEVINVIKHRGPDGDGWREFNTTYGQLILGHRRLNIVNTSNDLEQPFSSVCGNYWIVFNGEIYNYPAIKRELEKKGYHFKSQTDTEVLLNAYIEWKESALTKLNGMFAFVIYDKTKNLLIAARDQFGIKPLYLYYDNSGVCFFSEIKQVLKLDVVSPRANLARCVDYLHYGITNHTSETMFENIYEVRAGEYATINFSLNSRPNVKKWSNLTEDKSSDNHNIDVFSQHLEKLLIKSIKLQTKADVPVGFCLSGGLDSSAINAVARQISPNKSLTSFSILNHFTEIDESRFIDTVIEHLQIENKSTNLDINDFLPNLEKVLWHQDEPFGGTSLFAQWKLFDLASQHGYKVLLCGQGADELLAGYDHLPALHRAHLAKKLGIPVSAIHLDENDQLSNKPISYLLAELTPSEDYKRNLFRIKCENDINSVCRNLVSTNSLPMLLRYKDRNSMAHSIEARVPFLDKNLATFALALDTDYKIFHGQTKYILRYLLKNKLPEKITQRRQKIGFSSPEHLWLKNEKLITLIQKTIRELLPSWPHLFSDKAILDFSGSNAAINPSNMFYMWRIFCFLLWSKRLHS